MTTISNAGIVIPVVLLTGGAVLTVGALIVSYWAIQ